MLPPSPQPTATVRAPTVTAPTEPTGTPEPTAAPTATVVPPTVAPTVTKAATTSPAGDRQNSPLAIPAARLRQLGLSYRDASGEQTTEGRALLAKHLGRRLLSNEWTRDDKASVIQVGDFRAEFPSSEDAAAYFPEGVALARRNIQKEGISLRAVSNAPRLGDESDVRTGSFESRGIQFRLYVVAFRVDRIFGGVTVIGDETLTQNQAMELARVAAQQVARTLDGASEPVATPVRSGAVLFEDDFSDQSGGWSSYISDRYMAGYVPGAYRIHVNAPNTYIPATRDERLRDVSIEVDVRKVAGPDGANLFGLICRRADDSNFYYLAISSNGQYGIFRVISDDEGRERISILGPVNADGQPLDVYPSSTAIRKGNATNRLRGDCVRDKLTLYANGEKLVEAKLEPAEGDAIASGDVGYVAHATSQPGIDVRFDNFIARQP